MTNVVISEMDAINIQQALDTARSFTALLDIQEGLRKLNRQTRSSALTLALDEAYERLSKYLEVEDGVS